MPRQPRIQIAGSLYHVMARGIHGQDLFYDKKDFDHFASRLAELFITTDHTCYAWALLNNHFHLLIKSGETPLSLLMRKMLTGHAVYFNRRHKRSGHLFQNRFKSILCQEDAYFLQLVRYIHLNPIRAGLVKSIRSLNSYKYSGHAYILGELTNDWQDTQTPLLWFGKQKNRSVQKYIDYMKAGLTEGKREDLTGGGLLRTAGGWKGLKDLRKRGQSILGDERMLGDSNFVEETLKQFDEPIESSHSVRNDYSLDQLTKDVCHHFDVSPTDVKGASKQRNLIKAKGMICYVATRNLKTKGTELATFLNISKSTVSKLVSGFQSNEQYAEFINIYM